MKNDTIPVRVEIARKEGKYNEKEFYRSFGPVEKIEVISGSISISEKTKNGVSSNEIRFDIAGDNIETQKLIRDLLTFSWLVVVTLADDTRKAIGSEKYPVRFEKDEKNSRNNIISLRGSTYAEMKFFNDSIGSFNESFNLSFDIW